MSKNRKLYAMTVGQVIEQLSKYPKDYRVFAYGCDCVNPVNKVNTDEERNPGVVYLKVNSFV